MSTETLFFANSDLIGPDGVRLQQRLPVAPPSPEFFQMGGGLANLLLAGERVPFVSQGIEFEAFLEDRAYILNFLKNLPLLLEAKVRESIKITHVSQLGGVRGVPGAVGAVSGLGIGAAFFFRGEIPPDYPELILKLATATVIGGSVLEIGYRIAGALGARKQRDLELIMKQEAAANAHEELARELRAALLERLRFRPLGEAAAGFRSEVGKRGFS